MVQDLIRRLELRLPRQRYMSFATGPKMSFTRKLFQGRNSANNDLHLMPPRANCVLDKLAADHLRPPKRVDVSAVCLVGATTAWHDNLKSCVRGRYSATFGDVPPVSSGPISYRMVRVIIGVDGI